MNTVYTFSNGVHVDSSTIEKIKKAYVEIVKKELIRLNQLVSVANEIVGGAI